VKGSSEKTCLFSCLGAELPRLPQVAFLSVPVLRAQISLAKLLDVAIVWWLSVALGALALKTAQSKIMHD